MGTHYFSNKGITLVALVITVIVLLILAGVAISAIVGEDGIFSKARMATEKYNNAAENEAKDINLIMSNLENEPELEPEPNGQFVASKGVNIPDTSKLPTATTKYVIWTGIDTFTEVLSNSVPKNWYDYGNSKWANMKTTSTDGSLEAYWVWIPRFAYKLPESATAKTIEVAFVKDKGTTAINPTTGAEEQAYYTTDTAITTDGSGVYIKKTGDAASKWIIHPAFSFGNSTKLNENTQLSGIWVAKYEVNSSNPGASNGGDNTTSLKVQIKPNVTSWRNILSANAFTVCREIQNNGGVLGTVTGTTSVDTHMIKNIEWGAVAILSQSKYGNYDRDTNSNIQIWNNPNQNYITGMSGNQPDSINLANANCSQYNTSIGVKASTTGNVYGIYDMAGGAWEIVSGILNGYTNRLGNSIEQKYYDVYTSQGSSSNYNAGKIGDMTKELLPSSSRTWNSDYAESLYEASMFYRGGRNDPEVVTNSGIFAFVDYTNDTSAAWSFRASLIIL